MHRLLSRQMKRYLGHQELDQLSPEVRSLLDAVDQAYVGFDEDRSMLERSLELSSQELMERNRELGRSNEELAQFAYIASHDLQEPLRKIMAFGSRLRKSLLDIGDREKDYLLRMENAAGRMQKLIEDLLSYSRVTTKARPSESIDLSVLLQEVLSDLEIRLTQSKGAVELQPLPKIRADRLQMRQLFQNLLANALKFSRPEVPPHVTIRVVKQEKGLATFEVEDNGIGFEAQYKDKIFRPFERLHGREQYEGSGIGLAICFKIVERHGGQLSAQSTPGEGTTFTFTLPICEPQPPQ